MQNFCSSAIWLEAVCAHPSISGEKIDPKDVDSSTLNTTNLDENLDVIFTRKTEAKKLEVPS